MRQFTVRARRDPEAGIWWASNDQLPLTTEAASLDALMDRVMEIAPEMASLNGHVAPGEAFEIHFIVDQVAAAAA